ncbi:winged helix-turn-helix transcriptional regulator [Hymenobacter cellulosivorans]|uniref:Helix-turn-helix transcriptional regulator n=1 Tax=Hymenobacter cellulosivorans TaxID=2932249 RepID=A0ABY4FFL3_9BACT|nr:helix-turn-helix domain-containing protein [Hymenobacter cellulosivorans]UOQ54798.1 helix-turn-helix transcriptional regulator [Hymenobacter cellulosivorans]
MALSQEKIILNCPFRQTLDVLEGKWKFAIIHSLLLHGTMRFKALERDVEGITARMLIKELKLLEAHGIVHRRAYATVPPTVEYSLTECGQSLEPIIQAIQAWGIQNQAVITQSKISTARKTPAAARKA